MKQTELDRTYSIKYTMNSGKTYGVKVNTCISSWNDISKEQQEDELIGYGISELACDGIYLRPKTIKHVEIKEEEEI